MGEPVSNAYKMPSYEEDLAEATYALNRAFEDIRAAEENLQRVLKRRAEIIGLMEEEKRNG